MRLAIVDIGSNSTRLFLCEGIGDEGPTGERDSRITGLRRGAADDGSVTEAAITRLADALDEYSQRISEFDPDRTIAIGTSAARDAPNRAQVAAAVEAALDTDLRVISGEFEADLAYRGARLASAEGRAAVIDIGGGSTEVVTGDGMHRGGAVSLQRGALRCTEEHLGADPPQLMELVGLRAALAAAMDAAVEMIGGAQEHVIGVAGTFTTIAAIDIGRYDPALVHGHRVSRADLRGIADRLAAVALEERRQIPGLHPGRAPYIVAGAEIALAALDALGADAVQVSERDILDGVALSATDPERTVFL